MKCPYNKYDCEFIDTSGETMLISCSQCENYIIGNRVESIKRRIKKSKKKHGLDSRKEVSRVR
jgi:hypothetical protein